MLNTIITAVISFASTNVDDIFVLMLFFSQVNHGLKKHHIIIGQYLGITCLLLISIFGSIGMNLIPQNYTGLLGFIPIFLGIKEWLTYLKDKKETPHSVKESASGLQVETTTNLIANPSANSVAVDRNNDHVQKKIKIRQKAKHFINKIIPTGIINIFLVTIANGADNIGVYIPLFSMMDFYELIITIIIFLSLIAAWCYAGERLINIPQIRNTIQQYKKVIVPVVFILIGIIIIADSGFIEFIIG